MNLISAKNLKFCYGKKAVLEDVNFNVNLGDFIFIVGKNGAGKTTLIKGLLNLKKPFKGEIIFDKDLKNNEIGYLSQHVNEYKNFPATVKEIVFSGYVNKLKFRNFFTKNEKDIIYKNMEQMDILSLKDKAYRELSGGLKQRVLLARALCASKKIILLDEPTNGLDPIFKSEFYKLIKKINEELKMTIIIVSHDTKDILKYSSHILHLQSKQLFFGKKEEYMQTDFCKTLLMES